MMRFLIVDDEPDLQMILQINLQRWGHDTEIAGSAEEAHQAICARPPDAMLLDVSLPGATGIDLIRRLRGEGRLPPSVALLSAMVPSSLATQAGIEGISHLAKPFGLADLRSLVTEMVASSAAALPADASGHP